MSRHADVALLSIHRPEHRNAINLEVIEELEREVEAALDTGARALVFSGSGGTFSAGADLNMVREAFDGDTSAVLGPLVDSLHALIRRLRALPIPTIAAVRGHAVGAAIGLAFASDLRVFGDSASLVPGYLRIGASPDGGVSYFLTRTLGAARASSVILRNVPLSAAELERAGAVDTVVSDNDVIATALELAHKVAGTAPFALIRLRELVDAATTQGLDAHLDAERETIAGLWRTFDFREGVKAFLDRRQPQFAVHWGISRPDLHLKSHA